MKIKMINRFSERAFEAVSGMLTQLSPDAALLTRDNFKSILASEGSHLFISELDNKKITGMLSIGTYQTPTGIKVWIEDVVVDESYRGKGIGKELMIFALNYSKSLGAKDVRLTSRPSRIAANKLYSKLGFKKYETNFYKYMLDN
jgi:ribosomal protein S18 acetylase RimI-like enzyme